MKRDHLGWMFEHSGKPVRARVGPSTEYIACSMGSRQPLFKKLTPADFNRAIHPAIEAGTEASAVVHTLIAAV